MAGFVKIHDLILGSSIMDEDVETRFLWIVVLALADRNGNFRATPKSLARISNLRPMAVANGLEILQNPDPSSSTPDEEGRRLIQVEPNEWHIVNYKKYRAMRDPDKEREDAAERKRRSRAKKASQDVTENHYIAEAEAEAEAENIQVGISMDDLELVMKAWNNRAAGPCGLPEGKNKTRKRLQALRARCKEHKLEPTELIDAIVDRVTNSKFLRGESGRDSWVGATFDWCMRPTNLVKILEGNYTDKKKWPSAGQATATQQETEELKQDHKKCCEIARKAVVLQMGKAAVECPEAMEKLIALEKAIDEAIEMPPGDGYRRVVEAEEFFLDWMADELEEKSGAPLPAQSATGRRYYVRKHLDMPVLY